MSNEFLIVGGGIAGITAALLLSEQGFRVKLVDSAPELGGLLRSRSRGKWGDFDYGTHYIHETGVADLDHILFSGVTGSPDWIGHRHCTQDIFFAGHRRCSSFLDVRLLGPELHERAWQEMLSLPPPTNQSANLLELITAAYGPTLEKNVFAPLMQKMYGARLDELAKDASHYYGLSRLIIGTEDESRQLKSANSWHDDRIAFHQLTEGANDRINFYPRHCGIGLWVKQAEVLLLAAGAEILTSSQINIFEMDNTGRQVVAVVINNERRIPCDMVLWTSPISYLLKLAGLPIPSFVSPPRNRRVIFLDLVLDHPLNSQSHYITCCDPSLRTFRVTNYGALQNLTNRTPSKVTLEIFTDSIVKAEINPEDFLAELVAMDLVSAEAKILHAWLDGVGIGFPFLSPSYKKDAITLADLITSRLDNVLLGARASGRVFLSHDVVTDIYEQLQSLKLSI